MISALKYEQKVFIRCALSNPRQLRLLFRASEHGFKVAKFHEHCDNIENTLTLVRTEFGKTVGGFTKYKWSQGTNYYVNNSGR